MVSATVKVIDETGLHMKPAGILCRKAVKFRSTVKIKNETGIYNAKSVLSVLGACVRYGDEIELICEGPDEEEALNTLVHDISHKLYKEELLENSYTLAQIEDMTKDGSIDKAILPVDRMFEEFPAVSTKPEYDRILQNGNPLKPDMISGEYRDMSYIRVYDSTGCFKAVYTCEKNRTYLKPYKMFI